MILLGTTPPSARAATIRSPTTRRQIVKVSIGPRPGGCRGRGTETSENGSLQLAEQRVCIASATGVATLVFSELLQLQDRRRAKSPAVNVSRHSPHSGRTYTAGTRLGVDDREGAGTARVYTQDQPGKFFNEPSGRSSGEHEKTRLEKRLTVIVRVLGHGNPPPHAADEQG